ncbi:flagellar biosynthetic protein FliO [Fictibacillus iocasae]|uniref:Flagellar biosynthetic protein FliO n=1 Tax=Fictibacillus iocasae TaxID=2715437 RepID=A0ABW2NSJ5_9BACL
MFKLAKLTAVFMLIVLFPLLGETASAQSYASSGKSVSDWIDNDQENNSKQAEKAAAAKNESSGSTFFMILKLLVMLGIVIALLVFVLKFIQKKSAGFQHGKALQLLGGVGLGPSRSLQAVKAGNSILLLGVGENVTLIKEITDDETIEQLEGLNRTEKKEFNGYGAQNNGSLPFKELLMNQLKDLSESRKKITERLKEGNTDE